MFLFNRNCRKYFELILEIETVRLKTFMKEDFQKCLESAETTGVTEFEQGEVIF